MISNFDIMRRANSERELSREFVSGARKPGLDIEEQTREETITLVRQVFFSGSTIPQVVIFSAVERGSGCTWVCSRAANVLSAHVDGLVCLVDGDLRTPSLHSHFELEQSSTAMDEEFRLAPVRQSGRPLSESNLWLLSKRSAGTNSQTPQSLERLRSRVSELRKDFTYIVVDAPPINAYSDAALLGSAADGLVMVLEANDTRREAAIRAKDTLNAAAVPLLGAVLNKRTFPIPETLYRKL